MDGHGIGRAIIAYVYLLDIGVQPRAPDNVDIARPGGGHGIQALAAECGRDDGARQG